ncbi:hypothetical protein ACLOJK_003725 [Asimina triloba]
MPSSESAASLYTSDSLTYHASSGMFYFSYVEAPCADHPRRRQQRLTHDPSVCLRSFAWICLERPQPLAPASVRPSRRSCPSTSNQLGFAETHLVTDLHTAPAGSSVRRSRTHSPPSSRPAARPSRSLPDPFISGMPIPQPARSISPTTLATTLLGQRPPDLVQIHLVVAPTLSAVQQCQIRPPAPSRSRSAATIIVGVTPSVNSNNSPSDSEIGYSPAIPKTHQQRQPLAVRPLARRTSAAARCPLPIDARPPPSAASRVRPHRRPVELPPFGEEGGAPYYGAPAAHRNFSAPSGILRHSSATSSVVDPTVPRHHFNFAM